MLAVALVVPLPELVQAQVWVLYVAEAVVALLEQ